VAISTLSRSRLLTTAQVAGIVDVHPETVRRWVNSGELRAIRLGPGRQARIRISPEELAAFIRASHDETRPRVIAGAQTPRRSFR